MRAVKIMFRSMKSSVSGFKAFCPVIEEQLFLNSKLGTRAFL